MPSRLYHVCGCRPALARPTFTSICTSPMTHFCEGVWLNYVKTGHSLIEDQEGLERQPESFLTQSVVQLSSAHELDDTPPPLTGTWDAVPRVQKPTFASPAHEQSSPWHWYGSSQDEPYVLHLPLLEQGQQQFSFLQMLALKAWMGSWSSQGYELQIHPSRPGQKICQAQVILDEGHEQGNWTKEWDSRPCRRLEPSPLCHRNTYLTILFTQIARITLTMIKDGQVWDRIAVSHSHMAHNRASSHEHMHPLVPWKL